MPQLIHTTDPQQEAFQREYERQRNNALANLLAGQQSMAMMSPASAPNGPFEAATQAVTAGLNQYNSMKRWEQMYQSNPWNALPAPIPGSVTPTTS